MEPSDPTLEPDYRFTLANERTFLAWIRTALALIAGGVAVVQLVPALSIPGVRHGLGSVLTLRVDCWRCWRFGAGRACSLRCGGVWSCPDRGCRCCSARSSSQ